MLSVFLNFYVDQDVRRNKELQSCLANNLDNPYIENVYLIGEPEELKQVTRNNKIKLVPLNGRPTFRDFFEAFKFSNSTHNAVINSDIFLGTEIELINSNTLNDNQCFALTRYDILPNGEVKFLNRRDSQDVWIFKGQARHEKIWCDFYLGRPGVDNRIAHELQEIGYQITNPSLTIKSYHLHNSQVKSYTRCEEHVIPPPYLRLDPVSL